MQKNPLIAAMVGALLLGSVAIFGLAILYEYHFRQLRRLQPQVIAAQNNRTLVAGLMAEALEYSKRNPAIDPILESIGAKPGRFPSGATARTPAK
jgi:hypothetical protein